jgi:putative glycosyltransferase (TIGR04348 family)
MTRPQIVIVTPALAAANNGNWQTARRWAAFLRAAYRVRVLGSWPEPGADPRADPAAVLIALHARRSAASVAAWRQGHPQRPLVVVLTGTDLYRDIEGDSSAKRSLALADRLVVLNRLGARRLPAALAARTLTCLQSAPARAPRGPKPRRHLRAVVVGHLREEKDPRTVFAAVRRLAGRSDIRVDHIGDALDATLGDEARALAAAVPAYRWLGALPHAATRARIAAAHVLVHASRLEGGAHVVIEALTSGTPVLASRIDGNLGLLGEDWPASFDPGDAAGLAHGLERLRDEPAMLPALEAAAARVAADFAPERERAVLLGLVSGLLNEGTAPP